jgi:hypothetical protein
MGIVARSVARMERSEVRGHVAERRTIPDYASLHPGYGALPELHSPRFFKSSGRGIEMTL